MTARRIVVTDNASTGRAAVGGDPTPFHELVKSRRLSEVTDGFATIGHDFLVELLRPVLGRLRFDEEFYRESNEDVAKAEQHGWISDLWSHYVKFGFFENRLPCPVEVDAAFYARTYPDVAVAIREGRIRSAQVHFQQVGFAEGRVPHPGWTFADLIEDRVP